MKTPEELAEEYLATIDGYYWGNTTPDETTIDAFLAGYAAANRWISVEEELPELGSVLAVEVIPPTKKQDALGNPYFTDRYIRMCSSVYLHQQKQFPEDSGSRFSHWQPLPPLPEK